MKNLGILNIENDVFKCINIFFIKNTQKAKTLLLKQNTLKVKTELIS